MTLVVAITSFAETVKDNIVLVKVCEHCDWLSSVLTPLFDAYLNHSKKDTITNVTSMLFKREPMRTITCDMKL